MNQIEKIAKESKHFEEYCSSYFNHISKLLSQLDKSKITAAMREIFSARDLTKTIFIIGNGGSAATASHMSNDLLIGTRTQNNEKPFRVISLTDNVAVMTALGNDTDYKNIFRGQLEKLFQPEDLLIAISASGNSPNILAACEYVKSKKGKIIGFSGFDGGELKFLADINVVVETEKGEYGPVEDIHMILDHLMHGWMYYRRESP